MPSLRITTGVSQEESTAVQRRFLTRGSWTQERESYFSPNRELILGLELKTETASGLRLFAASLETRSGRRSTVSGNKLSKQFLSPGRYGRGYDHWNGSPWRPDSSQIALFGFDANGSRGYGAGSLFDVSSRKWTRFSEGPSLLSHHMWSPTGEYYLFRDMRNWYLLDVKIGQSRRLSEVNGYPRHAHFVADDLILLMEDSFRVISAENLDLLAEESHPEINNVGSDRYSFYDDESNRVLLGVGTSILDFVISDNWYAIEVI